MPTPLEILYPNGRVEAVQVFIWDGAKPILWDGSVTFSGSLPSTVAGNLTNNNAAPAANNLGALTAIANASAPTYSEGKQVLLSTDLGGALRVLAIFPATIAVTQSGTWNINNVSGTVSLPTGAATATHQTDGSALATTGKTLKTASGSFTSDTDVIAAVTSKRLKVFALKVETFGTSATTVIWKSNGTGGTELWRSIVQAITGTKDGETQSTSVPSFLFATVAGEKLTADTNTGDTIHYSMSYWDDDAT